MVFITKEWLEENEACIAGKNWVLKNAPNMEGVELVKRVAKYKWDWANWLIVRLMDRKQCVAYVRYAAEQVFHIYEDKYPNNRRLELAIEIARKVSENDVAKNRDDDAAYAAADDAVYAVYSDYADAVVADAAAEAAAEARKEMQSKILTYGLELLEREI